MSKVKHEEWIRILASHHQVSTGFDILKAPKCSDEVRATLVVALQELLDGCILPTLVGMACDDLRCGPTKITEEMKAYIIERRKEASDIFSFLKDDKNVH